MEKIQVLYEDNHVIVVVKPYRIPSQEDNSNDTDMLTIVKEYIKEKYQKPGKVFVGLVHRLDRVTGGLMVFAKTSKAASRLSEQIRTNQIEKEYLAVVHGSLKIPSGQLEDFVKKSSSKNIVSVCSKHDKNAKKCILNYHVISRLPDYSLINVHLLTGRSHQIRVQFSSRGHSIVGDVKYGSAEKLRGHIALWAYKLSFFHPTKKEKMEFTYFPGEHPFNLFHI
ncbi:RluA family pseudouridine synthase [Filifactor alocis]